MNDREQPPAGPPEQKKGPEGAKEQSVSAEVERIKNELIRIARSAEKSEEPESIAKRLSEGMKELLVDAESRYPQEDMQSLAKQLEEDITSTNEFFPNDFEKNEAVKEKVMKHLADYLTFEKELREAA